MLSGLPVWGRVLLGLLALALAMGALALMLAPLRAFLDRQAQPPLPDRAPAHVCGHCGRILSSGTMPPIISSCPSDDAQCTRPRR